jgi:thiol-disulfide isomerase/thioredoxin
MLRRRIVIFSTIGLLAGLVLVAVLASGSGETRSRRRAHRNLGGVEGLVVYDFGSRRRVDVAAEFAGKPLVVNFWASWCPFCIAEMPDFQKVHESLGDKIGLLGVNEQDEPGSARELLKGTGVEYRLASDPDGKVFRFFRSTGMPTTVFIDESGVIVDKVTGPLTTETLRARIRRNFGI